jgi:uncharacterized protein YcgI (DUF1989 family)
MEKKVVFEEVIPPKNALSFIVKKGQFLRIIDLEGKQVGDLVLFNENDYTEKFSPAYTRWTNGRKRDSPKSWSMVQGFTTGHILFSTLLTQMATVTADTPVPGGIHDLMLRMCTSWVYKAAGIQSQKGCLELLAESLEPYGIAKGDIPNPMNVFMNVRYDPTNGMLLIDEPVSRPGDYVEIRTEMDCLVALSTCPDEIVSLCNGHPPHPAKPLKIEILEE